MLPVNKFLALCSFAAVLLFSARQVKVVHPVARPISGNDMIATRTNANACVNIRQHGQHDDGMAE